MFWSERPVDLQEPDAVAARPQIVYRMGTAAVITTHLGYIAFLVAGGFFVRRRPVVMAMHVSAMVATSVIFFGHLDCPLTGLERRLRRLSGRDGYQGGFVAHYLVDPLKAGDLTSTVHLVMPGVLLALNAVAYRRALRPS